MSKVSHDVPVLISQYIAALGNDDEACQTYIQELVGLFTIGELSLLQLIQKLGLSLTSDHDLIRSKSMQLLASILRELPSNHLSKQDIGVMVDFLMNKFDDKLSLIHALNGLGTLVRNKNYIASLNTDKILTKLLNAYDPKKNLAKVRYEAFQILAGLMENCLTYLKTGPEQVNNLFVKAFIHIASGEKDPRNLVASFKLNLDINENFEFSKVNKLHQDFVTDLFDVCFCYFPISFTPPANDPYKITASELKGKLRQTIASQSQFASEAIPNLVEKLASTNPIIRNDTLETIKLCIEKYDNETMDEQWLGLWNALKFEILHNDVAMFKPDAKARAIIPLDYEDIDDNDDSKVVFSALDILQKLLQKIPNFDDMLKVVVNELAPNLTSNKAKQSVIILSTLAGASAESFNYIVDFLFQNRIWGKYFNMEEFDGDGDNDYGLDDDDDDDNNNDNNNNNNDNNREKDVALDISHQRDLVDNLGYILTAYVPNKTILPKYKDYILVFLSQLLTTSSNLERTLRIKVIQQSIKLISLPQFLSVSNIELILNNFRCLIFSSIDEGNSKDAVLSELIRDLSLVTQDEPSITPLVIDGIINPLLNLLNEEGEGEGESEGEGEDEDEDVQEYKSISILKITQDLCVNNQILEVLSIRLMSKKYTSEKKFQLIVETFTSLIGKIETLQQFLTNSWYKNFIPKFMSIVMNLVADDSENYTLIESVGDLLRIIIRFIDVSKHQAILNEIVEIFATDSKSTSGLFQYNGNLLEAASVYISIYNKVLSALDKSCKMDTNTSACLAKVEKLVKTIQNDYLRIHYLQHVCLLVNKYVVDKSDLNMDINFDDLRQFEIYIWTLRGLLCKIDKLGIDSLKNLLDIFANENTKIEDKQLISKSLPILFVDISIFTNPQLPKKIISKVANLEVKLLYKQHIFEIILPFLLPDNAQIEDQSDFDLKFYALSMIIENIPTNILVPHLSSFIPFVMRALQFSFKAPASTIMYKSSLHILQILLEQENDETKNILQTRSSELIPILVKLATTRIYQASGGILINDESIRKLSLIDLNLMFQKFECQRFQKQVLKSLQICLDDEKRSIRKLAVDLRQTLYEMI